MNGERGGIRPRPDPGYPICPDHNYEIRFKQNIKSPLEN